MAYDSGKELSIVRKEASLPTTSAQGTFLLHFQLPVPWPSGGPKGPKPGMT